MTAQDHQETLTTASWMTSQIIIAAAEKRPIGGLLQEFRRLVEAEAAARQVTELRAAVAEFLRLQDEYLATIGVYAMDVTRGAQMAAWRAVEAQISTLRLLSAGDKAEAPR